MCKSLATALLLAALRSVGTCAGSVWRAPSGDLLTTWRGRRAWRFALLVRGFGSAEPFARWSLAGAKRSGGSAEVHDQRKTADEKAARGAAATSVRAARRRRGVQDPGESPNRFAGVPSASRLAWLSSWRRGRGRRALARPRTNPRPRGLAGELPSGNAGGSVEIVERGRRRASGLPQIQ